VAALLATLLLALAVVVLPSSATWRLKLIGLYLAGKIPDLEPGDLVRVVKPGSSGYSNVRRLLETRNPFSVLTNPLAGDSSSARIGSTLFASRCAECHGVGGTGGPRAPSFVNHEFRHGASDWALYLNIRRGIAGTPMAPQQLSPDQTWQLVSFVAKPE
jgi:cytochrome c553